VIEEGDYVKVNGEWVEEGDDRLMARSIEVIDCDATPPPPDTMLTAAAFNGDRNGDDDWDDDNDCDHDWDHDWDDCHDWPCMGLKSGLRGPVTDIDRDECMIQVMGSSWIKLVMCETVPPDTIPDDSLLVATSMDGDKDHDWPWPGLDDIEIGDRVRVRVFQRPDDDTLYGYFLKTWNGTPDKVYGKVEWVSAPSGPLEAINVLGVMIVITEKTNIEYCDRDRDDR